MEQQSTRAGDGALARRVRRRREEDRPTDPAPTSEAAAPHVTVIEPSTPGTGAELRELWRARETAFVFAWRDVKVRYKQSLIGIAWAVLQPLMTMVVFTLIFGKFANFPSQGQRYQIFVYSGLLPWMFFSTALTQISNSVVSNRQLVQKVYFPRLILPISGVLVPAVDFVFSSAVLGGLMIWYDVPFHRTVLLAPIFLVILAVTALGVGSFLATVNVRYRDVPYAIPFLIQTWLYLSPVIYPSAAIPERWQVLLSLNPIVAAITGFRWAVLGTPQPTTLQWGLGLTMTLVFVVVGFGIYRRAETRFADTI